MSDTKNLVLAKKLVALAKTLIEARFDSRDIHVLPSLSSLNMEAYKIEPSVSRWFMECGLLDDPVEHESSYAYVITQHPSQRKNVDRDRQMLMDSGDDNWQRHAREDFTVTVYKKGKGKVSGAGGVMSLKLNENDSYEGYVDRRSLARALDSNWRFSAE